MEKSEIRLKSEILHSCILITHLWRIPLLWTADFIQKKKVTDHSFCIALNLVIYPLIFLHFPPERIHFFLKNGLRH